MAATVMTVEFGTIHYYSSLEENSEACLCSSLSYVRDPLVDLLRPSAEDPPVEFLRSGAENPPLDLPRPGAETFFFSI